MIEERIILDALTTKSVSLVKQKVVIEGEIEYPFGEQWRRAYENTEEGIEDLKREVPEPYLSTILNLWINK